jgi:hypothetical protein
MFDGTFEMWKQERGKERGKIMSEEGKRAIDDDVAGLVMSRRKWTITMTNEHHLILKREMDRKCNNR